MMNETGVDGGMTGYSALVNPSVFSKNIDSLENIITNYLIIARVHKNDMIDILRHIAWMLNATEFTKEDKANLFKCLNLDDLM